jgi:hypothetical protein
MTEGSDTIEVRYGSMVPTISGTDFTVGVENLDGTGGINVASATIGAGNITLTYSPVVSPCAPTGCDDIDFNNDEVFPDDQDVVDFFNVLAGADCPQCNDIDFNNNDVFPEDQDVIDFFNVLAGGECP